MSRSWIAGIQFAIAALLLLTGLGKIVPPILSNQSQSEVENAATTPELNAHIRDSVSDLKCIIEDLSRSICDLIRSRVGDYFFTAAFASGTSLSLEQFIRRAYEQGKNKTASPTVLRIERTYLLRPRALRIGMLG